MYASLNDIKDQNVRDVLDEIIKCVTALESAAYFHIPVEDENGNPVKVVKPGHLLCVTKTEKRSIRNLVGYLEETLGVQFKRVVGSSDEGAF